MQRVADVKPSSASQPVSESTFADLLKPPIEPGFRLALAMLHDAQAAEDAVQEASFTAWRKLGRMHDQGRLRPWFLGVVANKCRNARRKEVGRGSECRRARGTAGRLVGGSNAAECGSAPCNFSSGA